ncbi:MAG TPA: adenylosuccinate synthase [Gaiellaceae bacterium]|nr:adenylosuccinate synthase [Gaiellaceae bacterium]
MPATVIVGAQWGDEGKGKIVDLLARDSDVVCRYQGGPNAGHTIVRDGETFKLHHVPSGILYAGTVCVVGAGCVVDPGLLVRELDDLEARGIPTAGVRVSGNAHLIMPWHVALDSVSERRLGKLQIGTTRRGIGPAYADKAARIGIRVQDILDPKILRQKFETALAEKNVQLERLHGVEPLQIETLADEMETHAIRLRPYVADTSLLVDQAIRNGRRVLLEGAQGTLLDLDHGTYPFVTSSNPVAGAASTGVGIGPTRIDRVLGVAKAYVTRVGEGPFPTEIEGPGQARVRELGAEYGTTTGRERRCGWLDLVALRFAVRVNGMTSLALTKLDVLSTFAEIPVCARYRIPVGAETEEFPAHQSDFHHAEPVYETLPGWREPLDDVEELDALPDAARRYVAYVEETLDVEVSLVSIGAERQRVVTLRGLAGVAGG